MRVWVASHGCRLSRAEADGLEAVFAGAGHELVDAAEGADLLWLDTCAVTGRADADARKAVRRAVRRNPNLRVVLSGCYAALDPEACAGLPGVVAVVGNRGKRSQVAGALAAEADLVPAHALVRSTALGRRDRSDWPDVAELPAALPRRRARALLRVQDGCDYGCSYCIVPRVRGPSRSLRPDEVVRRFEGLVAAGVPEVVVTGAHLGTYGRDLSPRQTLADLLRRLAARAGTTRLRLSSLDPHEVDDDLVGTLADSGGRICPHLHLPVQSGDDAVLRRMRRAYAARAFWVAVDRVRRVLPEATIGTDVIAGFPGEDGAAFDRTLALLERTGVDYVHAFAFSARPGTVAADLGPRVDPAVVRARVARLRAFGARREAALRARWAGRVVDVVLDRTVRGGRLRGVSDAYVGYAVEAAVPLRPGSRVRGRVSRCGTRVRVE